MSNSARKTLHPSTATFAGGCFWCTEAVFQRLKGVQKVTPGYTGGQKSNPTYQEVSSGTTGHAEALQIEFDPKVITYQTLLKVFFATHDPTTLNRQGADIGTQYRSAIFYHNQKQKDEAQRSINRLNKDQFNDQIVTELSPYKSFYPAEDYHQNYYNSNKSAGYCRLVIDPKIQKLYKDFKEITKNE